MSNACEHGQLKRQCPHCENNELIAENEKLKELMKLKDEYIMFLGKEVDDNAMYMNIHSIFPSAEKIKRGEELRAKIRAIEPKFKSS